MSRSHRLTRAAVVGAALTLGVAGCRVYATGTATPTPTATAPQQPNGSQGGIDTRDHRSEDPGGVETRDHRAPAPTAEPGVGPDRAGQRVTVRPSSTRPTPRPPATTQPTATPTTATPTTAIPPTTDPGRPSTVVDTRPGMIVDPVRPGIIIDPVRVEPGVGMLDIDPNRPLQGVTPFSIEPTAGPVGTGVTIYGEFATAKKLGDVGVTFGGGRSTPPVAVRPNAITVVVPKGSRTGPVTVRIKREPVWKGEFTVTPSDDGLVVATPVELGLVGAVYKLPNDTQKLPDFAQLGAPFAAIALPTLNVSPRRFTAGFPGLGGTDKLLEWFAIRFAGKLVMDKDAIAFFRLNSDDGAKLYVDGALVIDNDGIHPPQAQQGAIRLSTGVHEIVVDYFQGPRYELALELAWRFDEGEPWRPVPAAKLRRY